MKHLARLICTLIICSVYSACFGTENAFYLLRSNSPAQISSSLNTVASLQQHYKSIQLLISQAYQVDQNGVVWGYLDSDVERFAKAHQMKIMVLVTNANFDKDKTHLFLNNPAAEERAIETLVTACVQKHYYGVQLDYEMIALDDRNALTTFYQHAADALHKKGLVVSFAVAPVVSGNPQSSDFLKRLYTNWEGAYDLKALGQSADFVSIMAYNQHGEGTTPGSTASLPWVEETIKYALQFMPPEKISLGIPSFSTYWYTGTGSQDPNGKITSHTTVISFDNVSYLLQKYHGVTHWDDNGKFNYAIFDHNWLNEYIFVEDAASFKTKMDLAQKYHLRGVSVFYLGIEDPKIWNLLR